MNTSQDIIQQALANCDSEPVRTPGFIQPGGAVFAFHAETRQIDYASDNISEFLPDTPELPTVLTSALDDVLPLEAIHEINNSLTFALKSGLRTYATTTEGPTGPLELSVFPSGDHIVVEVEQTDETQQLNQQSLQNVLRMINRIDASQSESELVQEAVQLVKTLTGYDRVVGYRFDQSFNGACIAEARQSDMESYLGLRFPAWDIPAPARAVMADIPLRFINNSRALPITLLARDAALGPIDLTHARLRGVSPVHLEYLHNMGLGATLTLSLVVDGSLWGMISCHHTEPRTPSQQVRTLCEAILPLLQTKLELAIRNHALSITQEIEALRQTTLATFNRAPSLQEAFDTAAPSILRNLHACGLCLHVSGQNLTTGDIPQQALLDALIERASTSASGLFATDHLSTDFEGLAQDSDDISGAIAMSLGAATTCVVLRPSIATTIAWAGRPEKDISVDKGRVQLHPRASFARYLEDVEGKSEPWSATDLHTAQALFDAFVAAFKTEPSENPDVSRYQLMIQEMDHRFKNIFSLILSIAKKSRLSPNDPTEFGATLEARLAAMSAAHDMAFQDDGDGLSLHDLIEREFAMHLNAQTPSVTIMGSDHNLTRVAFQMLALVFHELAANSVKYGVLGPKDGTLIIETEMADGGLRILWNEQLSDPQDKVITPGFGSQMVQSAVEYELKGRSDMAISPYGVRADLWIPPSCTTDMAIGFQKPNSEADEFQPKTLRSKPTSYGLDRALIVEDSFAISVHIEELLRNAGVKDVASFSSGEDILERLDTWQPDLACLDIKVGEDSFAGLRIAETMLELEIPVFFITGYGSEYQLPDQFSGCQRLAKPITEHDLRLALSREFGGT